MSAKKWKRDFFENHPNCCFCGGTTAATTIDHIPSIQLFSLKKGLVDLNSLPAILAIRGQKAMNKLLL
jgi:hypothetical protein